MSDDKEYKKGGVDFQPGKMQKTFDQWVEEERAEHGMAHPSDSPELAQGEPGAEGGDAAVSGIDEALAIVPEPQPKTPKEMNEDPKQALEPPVIENEGYDLSFLDT